MARIDEVRERYESITEQLYKNKETFAEYLKFAGKFYKMPTAQTMTMFATNPKELNNLKYTPSTGALLELRAFSVAKGVFFYADL